MNESEFIILPSRIAAAGDCGPDLDSAGDDDHLNFLARVEGVLPASFAEFDRTQVDFTSEFKAAGALLERAIDLRVMVLLAKLAILDRRLPEFAAIVDAMGVTLAQHWEGTHPAGDIELRRGVLMALDDMPHTVMPLQAVPLFESRNLGRVSYRHFLVANGQAQPRENEDSYQANAISTALERAEDSELAASLAALEQLQSGLDAMAGAFRRHIGAGHEIALPNLRKLVQAQTAWLHGERARRNPTLAAIAPSADGDGGASAAQPAGTIATPEAAKAALDAVAGYFAAHEPSSFALLLVRQCRQLADASFLEAMRVLVPDALPQASIRIGKGIGFNIPIERLSAFEAPGDAEPAGNDTSWDTGENDQITLDPPVQSEENLEEETAQSEEPDESAGDQYTPEEPIEPSEIIIEENREDEALRAPTHINADAQMRWTIRSQQDALNCLADITQFYRLREPSSPLPLLLERARNLVGRDFLAVLSEMLPAAHLTPPEDS